MAKQSGLGDNLYIGGYDLSCDIGSLSRIGGGPAALDVTGICKSGYERIGGLRDGSIEFNAYFNDAAGRAHPVLKALPTTDVVVTYLRGTAVGSPSAVMVAKQINYDGTRGNDGSLTFAVQAQSNGYGIEWGKQLTAGIRAFANGLTGNNTTFETGVGNWVSNQNATLASTAAQAHSGTNSMSMTSVAGGNMSAKHTTTATNGFAVVPGQAVAVQAWVRSAVSARTCFVGINWHDAGGVYLSTGQGSNVTSSTSAWTLSSGLLVAPATAAFGVVIVQASSTGGAAEVHYVDDVLYEVQPTAVDLGADQGGFYDAQAYLQVTAFTGTDATIKIQTSTDNGVADAFADRITFTATTTAPSTERKTMTTPGSQIIERYARVVVTTTGGFTALSFAITLVVNDTVVVF